MAHDTSLKRAFPGLLDSLAAYAKTRSWAPGSYHLHVFINDDWGRLKFAAVIPGLQDRGWEETWRDLRELIGVAVQAGPFRDWSIGFSVRTTDQINALASAAIPEKYDELTEDTMTTSAS